MRYTGCMLFLWALCRLAGAAELVPFTLPWNDAAPGPTDLSTTIEKPAGKFGFIRVADGHLYAGKQRQKFFGVNFTSSACFPDHATADQVAARLAKFGLNAVRFHFLDATWGKFGLIRYDTGDWNPETLERLDYFIARLKERGIYTDLNLLVGRRFGVGDGVDPAVNQLDWKDAHAVGFFHAAHLEAQKAFARRLLTHVNPYTQLSYAEDPAVALVEINNENGLIHTWMGGGLDALPECFAHDLQQQWNLWLVQRYADSSALARAWHVRDEPPGGEMLINGSLASGLEGWRAEQHEAACVSASVTNETAHLRVDRVGRADWHVQFNQSNLVLRKGQVYTVRFRAAADCERSIGLSIMQAHAPWANLGISTALTLTPEKQLYSFVFVANATDHNARLNFSGMNQQGADFHFSALSLKPGGRVGLEGGESFDRRNISLPKAAGAWALTSGAHRDWIRFLWETEKAYWNEMRRFLKEELGVKAPIVGTIVSTSTPNLMAELDAVDSHAYWQHPRFPGRQWDRDDWTVENISMVDYPEKATVTKLAFQRVAGKPHIVSEYNHPAPNPHAGEAPLFIAACGAQQDWDAIFLYTYAHDDAKIKAGRIPDFFDIGQHPTIMANVPPASLLFRRSDLPPAREVLTFPLDPEREMDLITEKGGAWNVVALDSPGIDRRKAITHRIALNVGKQTAEPSARKRSADAVTTVPQGISWQLPAKNKGVFTFRGARGKGLIGHVDGQSIELGDGVRVQVAKTRTGWCTLALSLLEGESFASGPRRALLVATGYTENTDMGWKDKIRNSVGTDWGTPPSLVEPVTATLHLPYTGTPLMLYPLDEHGQRGKGIASAMVGEHSVQIHIGPPHKTLWYELSWLPQ